MEPKELILKPDAPVLQPPEQLAIEKRPTTAATADEARTEAVSELLTGAYQQASTLKLTESETKQLRAPFRDDQVNSGAKGDSRLLYISHIHVSDRLNDVLGLGQWAIVKRSQRAEQTKTAKGLPLTRIYFEGVLLIRGAFVAEAVGVGQYHPNNPMEDYGAALESAMSDCITRCCKRLGIGSQVWDKGYCDRWMKSAGGTRRPVQMPVEQPEPSVIPPEAVEVPQGEQTSQNEPPIDTSEAEASGKLTQVGVISKISEKSGEKNGKKWTRWGICLESEDGEQWYNTFDSKLAQEAEERRGGTVEVEYVLGRQFQGKDTRDLIAITVLGDSAE